MSDLRPINTLFPETPLWLRRVAPRLLFGVFFGSMLAGQVLALGLGPMTVYSRIGANFDGEVALLVSPEESRQMSECFRLAQPSEASAGLPTLTRGTVVVERKNGRPVLLVRSQQPINEPALVINLHAGCGAEVVREYTILLDAPPTAVDKPTTVSPNRSLAATSDVGAAKPALTRRPSPPNDADSYPAQWNAAGGDSARSITRALFPRQPKAQRRFLLALRQANPDLDFGDDGDAPLAAGQILQIPDTRRPRASRGADTLRQAPRPTVDETKSVPQESPASSNERRDLAVEAVLRDGMADRLSLSPSQPDGDAEADAGSLRLSTELSYEKVNVTTERQRDVLRLEYKLLASIYDQAKQQLALAEQVRQLEASVAELRAASEGSLAVTPTPAATVATATANSIPRAAEPDRQREAVTETSTSNGWYWLAGALLLVLLLAVVLRRNASRANQDAIADLPDELEPRSALRESDDEAKVPSLAPETLSSRPSERPNFSAPEDAGGAPETIASEQSVPSATAVVEHYEFDPVMELAEIMLAFGRVKGATEALEEYIETHPDGAVQPWMKLIAIYWENGLRSEYEALVPKFWGHFNVEPPEWPAIPDVSPSSAVDGSEAAASVDELLARTPNIAALPAVREALVRTWVATRLPEAHVFLNVLLHERKNAIYEGLSLSMVNEILFLLAAIEARLEKTATRNA